MRRGTGQLPEGVSTIGLSIALVVLALLVALSTAGAGPAAAQESPHGSLDISCEECHTTEGWRPLRDPVLHDHSQTGFLLRFGHRSVQCASCHQSLEFRFVPTSCIDCHADNHRGELGVACEDCHTPAGWDNRRRMWDLHNSTLFPLIGVHATVDCAACHRPDAPFEYTSTPLDCLSCHLADYEQTTEPDHIRVGFPTECELCHTPAGWQPARLDGGGGFDHNSFFVLSGAHRTLDCSACHRDGFGNTPTDCYSCHRGDYESTTDPNHAAAGISTNCENCHGSGSWEGAVLDHDRFFALTGQHRGLDCQDCHANGFAGTPRDCVACHRDDYNSTTDPNHAAAGFSTDCESCHNTSGWEGAVVDHDRFFRLTGAHRALDCQECHADGFAGTPTDCFACHRDDYNSTSDPNHAASGFPTDCELCHNTNSWDDAEFIDHDALFFPIFSGKHRGEWDQCSDCHTVSSNFSLFECINCHEHRREEMDKKHEDEEGYVYESTACLNCHPDGRE